MSTDAPPPDPEFRGVTMMTGGQFRLSNLTITIGPDGTPVLGPVEYQVRNELWHHWLEIAERAAEDCHADRAANPGPDNGPEFGRMLEAEMKHGMIAITSSAFALEAFTASLVVAEPAVRPPPPATGRSTPAYARIAETWRRAFTIIPGSVAPLRDALKKVFALRNMAVHPPSGFVTPGLHPVFHVAIDTRNLWFRTENAAVVPPFVRDVIGQLVRSAKPRFASVGEWAANQAKLLNSDDQGVPEAPS